MGDRCRRRARSPYNPCLIPCLVCSCAANPFRFVRVGWNRLWNRPMGCSCSRLFNWRLKSNFLYYTNMSRADDDWISLDVESKLNKKIDQLQTIVEQQSVLLQTMSEEIKQLKSELHPVGCQHLSSQNDRTHQLLEELKFLKQRELNMMLREKIPAPFVASNTIPTPFSLKQDPPRRL